MELKLQNFHQLEAVYKIIDGIPLGVSILVPKHIGSSEEAKCPLLVHFHGGGLVIGTRLDAPIMPLWETQFASYQSAVLVSPSYRLLPEATGSDILCDISEFWAWVHSDLSAAVSAILPNIVIDLTRIAAGGESAGGYLALQSAFLFPEMAIRLVMAQYPTLDISHPKFHSGPSRAPSKASIVDEYLKHLKPGAIRLSSPFPEKSKCLPAIWIVQGEDDHLMRRKHPTAQVHYSMQPGGHGFDVGISIDETWVQMGIEFSQAFW
ncbi:Alpha/Beta hydrolase protein [Fusarium oxysporum]|nr:Alpha/Beta hydrolase protein [Fusarium oxysporum]